MARRSPRQILEDIKANTMPGSVHLVDDGTIVFPENPRRTPHGPDSRRRVIVVQGPKWNGEGTPPHTVLVVPCSASPRGEVMPCDLDLPASTDGFTKDVRAYVSLVQPILKIDLGTKTGQLPRAVLDDLPSRLYSLLGLSHALHGGLDGR